MEKKFNIDDFSNIMDTLMGENGCPWDKEQTHDSLKSCLIEECYEVIDAIEKCDDVALCEELGDVLLQVMFHSKIAKKRNMFDFSDVTNSISEKMINRHRHIFGNDTASTSQEVVLKWEEIKQEEKGYQSISESMKNVPTVLPALLYAKKVLKKASENEVNEINAQDKFKKAEQMLNSLKHSTLDGKECKTELLGEFLCQIVNISTFLQVNPELALTNAVKTFINKFEDKEK